jgi:hypothetical protein
VISTTAITVVRPKIVRIAEPDSLAATRILRVAIAVGAIAKTSLLKASAVVA